MWTEKGLLFLAFGALLLFLALILKSFSLIIFSVFIFSFLAVGAFSIPKSRVRVKRELSATKLFEEGTTEAKLSVTGKGFVELKDELPKVFKIRAGNNCDTLLLSATKSQVLNYTLECPLRGVYQIGPLRVRAEDPFGLFYKETTLESFSELMVFPKIEELKELKLHAVRPRAIPGTLPVKYPGRGTEFFSMRDYVIGDPFKDINWKVYSRLRKLMVIQRELETTSDITLILDARAITGSGYVSSNPLLYSARAVAALSSFFLRRRCNVSLITYGKDIETLSLGYGEKQLYKILCALAGIKPEGNTAFRAVGKTLFSLATPQSLVILVSSLEQDETLRPGVKEVCDRGFSLMILTPSPLKLARKLSSETLEILGLEREVLLAELQTRGAEVIDWDPSMPLSPMLEVIELKR